MQVCAVFAVTVPLIAALIPAERVVILGPEHITALPPAASTSTTAGVSTANLPAGGAIGVFETPPATVPAPAHPAPKAVWRTAERHGGNGASRWVARECAEVAELVRRNGMPEWMTTVAWRESRCRHHVTNFDRRTADRSYGLFQINVLGNLWAESRERCGLKRPEQLLDPDVNVSCAAALYRAYGYQPWDSGRYFRG